MKNRIIWRFLGAHIFLILIAVIVLVFFVSLRLQEYYEQKISDKLISNSFLVGDILENDLLQSDQNQIQNKVQHLSENLNTRITVIDEKGKVLGDSEKDPLSMENHADRLEVVRAIENGTGESNRFSDTLGYNMKYIAIPVKDKNNLIGVVRLALPLTEVESQIRVIYRVVILGGFVAILITFIIGYFTSKNISTPITQMRDIAQRIAKGDFNKKINIRTKDELGALAKALNTMADELQVKIDNLNKMDKVRTDFVANVSHELKTPLTAIKGFIETLEDGALDDRNNAMRFISIIKNHTERLINIIGDLLSLSELELGKDRVNKSRFDLKDLAKEVVLGFGHAVSVKRQKLDLDFKSSNFLVNADKAKIEQVLVNLIDNAIKYTKEGGTIKVTVSEENSGFILSVSDSGIGIPKEHLPRIFERFYRIDKGRSRQLGGTGLGLAIVKHIVLLHNGNIDIDSQVNKGTKVTITLPKGL